MNDNKFNLQGYLVAKSDGNRQTFLSRQSSSQTSGGAIGQSGSNWTDQPNVDSLFSDRTEAQKLADQHEGRVIPAQLTIEASVTEQTS